MVQDPYCLENLIGEPALAATATKLEAQLITELKDQKDLRFLGKGKVFDQYLYSNEAGRNFYERQMNGENVKAGWVNKTDFESASQRKDLK